MKRTILAGIIGVASVAATFGQGHILVNNYINAPYAQVYWANGTSAGQAVTAASGLSFQVLYGQGVVADANLLTAGLTFQISSDAAAAAYNPGAGHGAGGYFLNVDQILPTWAAGQTWTFAYKVITDGYTGTSALWQENANILGTASSPLSSQSVGLAVTVVPVPEPTTFALAGLGSAALLIFRRRK